MFVSVLYLAGAAAMIVSVWLAARTAARFGWSGGWIGAVGATSTMLAFLLWRLWSSASAGQSPDLVEALVLAVFSGFALSGIYRFTEDRVNVDEARAAEEQSETRLRDIAESASDWFWECDSDLRFTYFSPRVTEITGVPVEFHYGKTREELAAESTRELNPDWDSHLADLQARKPFTDFRYLRKGHDGRLQFLSTSGKPWFDENGKFAGYRGVGRDVTSEWRNREAQRRLLGAIEALDAGIAIYDENDCFLLCNKAFVRLSNDIGGLMEPGMSFAEQIRMGVESGMFPDAIDDPETWIAERLAHRQTPGAAFEQPRTDGRWALIREQRLEDGGIVTLVTDISRQKEIEAALRRQENRLRDYAETAADWFWEQDAELRFVNVSEANQAITGMSVEDHFGKTRRETGIEGVSDEDLVAHEAVLERREPFSDFRFYRVNPDGETRYLSVSGKPCFDEAGNFTGYRGAGRDITSLVQSERTIRAERDRAEAANRAKSVFLANMSHELRTPLNAIIGFSDIIRNEIIGPLENRDYIASAESINEAGQVLLAIVNDVLDLAKVESGNLELEEKVVAVSHLINSATAMLSATALDAGLHLECKVPDDTVKIRVDERMITQILFNLISNAIKFSGDGKEVRISGAMEQGQVVMTVQDFGIGIPAKAIKGIFEPFAQVDQSLKREHSGTGLGLAIVRRMADLHKADVKIESEPDTGTTVTVAFPTSCLVMESD